MNKFSCGDKVMVRGFGYLGVGTVVDVVLPLFGEAEYRVDFPRSGGLTITEGKLEAKGGEVMRVAHSEGGEA